MSDEEGGDALHDNVLIEGDADAEAQAEEDIDAAPATEARTAKEERRRRRKEKKRKSEAAEEAAEQVAPFQSISTLSHLGLAFLCALRASFSH